MRKASFPMDHFHRSFPARCAVVGVLALVLLAPVAGVTLGAAQPEHAAPADAHGGAPPEPGAHGEAAAHGEGEAHGESLLAFLSRIANFVILAGGLYYLLAPPIRKYLDARGEQIRSDLRHAAETKAQATRSLGEIEARLKTLPAELEALKTRGQEEIAAEQVRLAKATEGERARLVDQTRREIDRQLQIARRDLTEHAADLAVGVARARLTREMTVEDQMRLVDRYVGEIGGRRE